VDRKARARGSDAHARALQIKALALLRRWHRDCNPALHAEDACAMPLEPQVAALTRLLCRYWRANPLACDTPDGIMRWWLPANHAAGVGEIQSALARLEARRLVERIVGRDGRVHFRLAPDVAAHPHLLDAHAEVPPGTVQ
jgi:hypothetical protein